MNYANLANTAKKTLKIRVCLCSKGRLFFRAFRVEKVISKQSQHAPEEPRAIALILPASSRYSQFFRVRR